MNLLDQIKRIERIDQLIRMKATGSPDEFAERLNISRSTLYNILELMKNQGVEVYYSSSKKSFCYKQEVFFYFGFSTQRVNLRHLTGGNDKFFNNFLQRPEFLDSSLLCLYQQCC